MFFSNKLVKDQSWKDSLFNSKTLKDYTLTELLVVLSEILSLEVFLLEILDMLLFKTMYSTMLKDTISPYKLDLKCSILLITT